MNRGARRAPIFIADEDCTLFLDLVEEITTRFEIEAHAFSLMPNHYHLLLRSRHGNLSQAMSHLNGTYTQKVNTWHYWDGPVFRGRFTNQLVQNEARLPYILSYIHLNPLRANLVTRIDSECWTSHRAYLGRRFSPAWITKTYFLDIFKTPKALQEYILALHRGKMDWPEQLDMETGFLNESEKAARRHGNANFKSRFLDTDNVLKLVTKITGASLTELKEPHRGPRANPARRFVVWALREHTLLKHREIGKAIDMPIRQVANVLTRIDPNEEPFLSWGQAWLKLPK
ncbi:MAG: hypothetical protein GY847_29965 [Proteobacteria bacterium]|nr:hypothetical protein [Pseudomonadota bacterium]